MRTTIDLPDELHRRAMSIARDTSRSLSETVSDLVRHALDHETSNEIGRSKRTGLPVVHVGTVITTEDVRALEDED